MRSLKHYREPVLDADGRPWVQICLICNHNVDIRRDAGKVDKNYVRVGEYIRHRQCDPPPFWERVKLPTENLGGQKT